MNRDEMLLETIIDKGSLPEDFTPQSRFESIAKSIINKEDYEENPQSRQEELFLEIGEMIKQGGGDTPTGTIDITENGKHNVSKYAEANVDVPKPFTDVMETTMTDGSFEIHGGYYRAYNTFNDVWYTELVNHIGIEDNTLCVEIDGNTIFANGEVRYSDYEQTTVDFLLQENAYGIYSIISTNSHTGLATAGVIQELVGKDIKLKIANEIYIRDNYTVVNVKDYAFAQIKWNPNLQTKEVTPTKELQHIDADGGYDGLGNVLVEPIPPEYTIPTGTLFVTENGVVDAKDYEYVDVSVQSQTRTNTLWTSENGEEVGDLGYTDQELMERYDIIRFIGKREGASGTNFLGAYPVTQIVSAANMNRAISMSAITNSQTYDVDTILTAFSFVNNIVNFEAVSHYQVTEANTSSARFLYEPPRITKLYRIVGVKF